MRTVLVTGAGGSMGVEVLQCLEQGPSDYQVIGLDTTREGRLFAQRHCMKAMAIPRADDPEFVPEFRKLVEQLDPLCVFVNPSAEALLLAGYPDLLARTACPPPAQVPIILDKRWTVEVCGQSAPFPWTAGLYDSRVGRRPPWWIRSALGQGGRAAMKVRSEIELEAWIVLHPDIESWMVQEYLPGDNLAVVQLWWRGELRAEAVARRDGYVLPKAAPSGISGEVSDLITVDRPDATAVAMAAVTALPGKPHGFYGVDLRDDERGQPRITEINTRLSGRPNLYPAAGVNFPRLWLRLLKGQRVKLVHTQPGVRILRRPAQEPIILEGEE